MQKKKLKSDFELPMLGIGTFSFGGNFERNNSNDDEDISAIKSAIKLDNNIKK